MKVSLSFKENEKHMYDFLMSQLSLSIYIKGLIKADMEKGEKKNQFKQQNNTDLLDF